jgi:hypothetical protein
MRQFVTNEQEAHRHALGRLKSELQRAWHEHGLANQERERLDTELARVVDGCNGLKTYMPKLIMDALKSGMGQLVTGSSDINVTSDINLLSPDVIAKISAVIDAELQAGICNRLSFCSPGLPDH